MKQKIVELTAIILFILSLISLCCVEYKTMAAEIIGLSISTVMFLVSAVLINRYYKDGRWV
jgi:hypothetical protein